MSSVDHELIDTLREALARVADPAKAAPMQAYMKSAMPFLGVPAPALRAAVRPVLARHRLPDEDAWQATLLELWDHAEHREERYAAIALARHRFYREHQQPPVLDLYEHLLRTGAWWDLVDEIATHLVQTVLLAHPGETIPVLHAWAVAEDLWVRRAAIICQCGTRDRCDRSLLVEAVLANLDGSTRTRAAASPYGRELFVRKAIGWALRDHAGTDPEWVRGFVAKHEEDLSGLSRREALRRLT